MKKEIKKKHALRNPVPPTLDAKSEFQARVMESQRSEVANLKSLQLAKKLVINFRDEKGNLKKTGFVAKFCIALINALGAHLDVQFYNLKK